MRASSSKEIAHELEVCVATVNAHLARICRLAGVERTQLVFYTLQHAAILDRDGWVTPGMHVPDCGCDEIYCRGIRRAA